MRHIILELALTLSFLQRTYSDGQKPDIFAEPRHPRANERVTIQCRWKGEPRIIVLSYGETSIKYYPKKNESTQFQVKVDPTWRAADQVTAAKNIVNKTLTLAFNAKAGEKIRFRCSEITTDYHYKLLVLDVLVPPNVTSLSLTPNKTVFHAGDEVTILCTVALGNPKTKDKDITFTAPGDGTDKSITNTHNLLRTYELKRTMKASSNGKAVECYASNEGGTSAVKRQYLKVLYGTRDIEMSVADVKLLDNINVSAGQEIRCSADGNPKPNVSITVTKFPESERSWTIKGATGLSHAIFAIPKNAMSAHYYFACNASNELDSKLIANISVNIIIKQSVTNKDTKNTTFFVWIFISAIVTVVASRSV